MKMTKILSLVIALVMIAACFTACPQKKDKITLCASRPDPLPGASHCGKSERFLRQAQ